MALARKIIERGSNTSNDDIPESASLRKLKQQSPDRGSDQYATQQWLIVHVARLNELIGDLSKLYWIWVANRSTKSGIL